MSVIDQILYEERLFRDRERNIPSIMYINPDDLAILREEIGVDDLEDLDVYHGMSVVVDEYTDSITLTTDEV